MNDSALFISTLNEIEALGKIFDIIPVSEFDEVYALDGGSTDGTVDFFQEHGIKVIPGIKKGAIFNAGAMNTEREYLVFFAPDGNEDPEDILRLLGKLKEGCDMVIASRFMKESKNEEDELVFKWRAWANRAFTLLVRLRWGGRLTDTINGFRSVRRSKLFEMNTEPTGFDIEFQMSIRGLKLGHRIYEIPTIEGGRAGGESTAYSFPTGWLMLKRYCRELFSGLPAPAGEKLRLE
ncbi:MAG: glycosyltransferase family 2 protein [Kiritimatiellia bacterium]